MLVTHSPELLGNIDIAQVLREWTALKRMVLRERQLLSKRYIAFWLDMIRDYSGPERYPLLLVVVLLVLLIAVDTSECERGFSLVNRLKTEERNRLLIAHLNDLACVCNHAVPTGSSKVQAIKHFNPQPILDMWMDGSRKGRYLGAKFNDLFQSTTEK